MMRRCPCSGRRKASVASVLLSMETRRSSTSSIVQEIGRAQTTVTGRVSHLRWSPRGDQVVFTLGRPTSGGGVLQDLYLWNLGEGDNPDSTMITNTGAAFGAEWRGSQNRWEED